MPSRQYLWQMKQLAKGNCIICGKPRIQYRYRCDICTARQRTAARQRKSRYLEAAARLSENPALSTPQPESALQMGTEPAATHRIRP